MDLILWRHAEAHIAREGQDDAERALTPKGERQAQRMAEWLNQRMAASTRVLVSPAVRAQETARALRRSFRTVDALGHDAGVDELLADIDKYWAMKKGAVWWLRRRERDGGAQVVLQAVQGPDLL